MTGLNEYFTRFTDPESATWEPVFLQFRTHLREVIDRGIFKDDLRSDVWGKDGDDLTERGHTQVGVIGFLLAGHYQEKISNQVEPFNDAFANIYAVTLTDVFKEFCCRRTFSGLTCRECNDRAGTLIEFCNRSGEPEKKELPMFLAEAC